MQWLDHSILEVTGLVLSIALIFALIRKGWSLYWTLILGSLLMAVFTSRSLPEALQTLYRALASPATLTLTLMVVSITVLGHLLQKTGILEQMVASLSHLIRDARILVMAIPAATSFLIVPGGAIISAPMADEAGKLIRMSREESALANIVFRHILVIIFPFGTSIILMAGLTGFELVQYVKFNLPVATALLLLAALIVFKKYPRTRTMPATAENKPGRVLAQLLLSFSPLALAMTLALGFNIYFPLAILSGIVLAVFINLPPQNKGRAFCNRAGMLVKGINWPMVLSIVTVMIFKEYVGQADFLINATGYLFKSGLPLPVLLMGLPFIASFTMGHSTAALSVMLPVFIPLLGVEMDSLKYFGLIYIGAYTGYFCSPLHLCTVVTSSYFETPLGPILKKVFCVGAVMLLAGFITFLIF